MSKKYITLDDAQSLYNTIRQQYVSPKFNGKDLITLPPIDFATIFGNRQRMDAETVTREICRIITEHIDNNC